MADEITARQLIDFQTNVVAKVGAENREAAHEWVRENNIDPRKLERTLERHAEKFSPNVGGTPLRLE